MPRESIVLLYGRAGIGKSALAWNIAQAVQEGRSIWGLPTVQTNVLFWELDTPRPLIHERWANGDPPFDPNFTVAFDDISIDYRQFLVPYPDEEHKRIKDKCEYIRAKRNPGLVIIDALRECVTGDLSMSGIARRVYDAFKLLFPGSTIVFIHHERKSGSNMLGPGDPLQAASGSMEFINVAQVALQFHKRGRETFLDHNKAQGSIQFPTLPVSLHEDGVWVSHRHTDRLDIAERIITANPTLGMRELDTLIGKEFGISDRAARNVRLGLNQRRQVGDHNYRGDAAVEGPVVGSNRRGRAEPSPADTTQGDGWDTETYESPGTLVEAPPEGQHE